MQKIIPLTLGFIFVALCIYILAIAESLFKPLLVGLVIAYFIISTVSAIKKIPHIGSYIPNFVLYLAAIALLFFSIIVIINFITNTVNSMFVALPNYQEKFTELVVRIQQTFKLKKLPDIVQYVDNLNFATLATMSLQFLTYLVSNIGMITIYVVFILVEHTFFQSKFHALFTNKEKREKAEAIISRISKQIQSYILIKTIMSLLTSTLSYAVLVSFGVDFASFWAFLIFLLNYIPTIGSIIATVFPCVLALLQFGKISTFIAVSFLLVSIQFIVGNIVEPRVMGKSFNLSGLVIILALVVWGWIWGIVGMILCVPILVIASIIMANFSETRPIAVLLSQDGELNA